MTDPDGQGERLRFGFAFAPAFRRPLALLGVGPATAWVRLDARWFTIRYGPWRLTTPRANVSAAGLTGPYRWWRAIGPHLSLADRGVTFGTDTRIGVCVRFATPVAALLPGRLLRHPAVTLTVDRPRELVAALSG